MAGPLRTRLQEQGRSENTRSPGGIPAGEVIGGSLRLADLGDAWTEARVQEEMGDPRGEAVHETEWLVCRWL